MCEPQLIDTSDGLGKVGDVSRLDIIAFHTDFFDNGLVHVVTTLHSQSQALLAGFSVLLQHVLLMESLVMNLALHGGLDFGL